MHGRAGTHSIWSSDSLSVWRTRLHYYSIAAGGGHEPEHRSEYFRRQNARAPRASEPHMAFALDTFARRSESHKLLVLTRHVSPLLPQRVDGNKPRTECKRSIGHPNFLINARTYGPCVVLTGGVSCFDRPTTVAWLKKGL